MIEERVIFALEKFLKLNYFSEIKSSYELREKEQQGKSLLKLEIGTEDNLCMQNYDNQTVSKCNFVREDRNIGIKKFIDHFVLRKNGNIWELHMIEMKTTIGFWSWIDVKYKMRASYLNIKALSIFLGIPLEDENIFTYTTYEKEGSFNSRVMPKLGGRIINLKKEEWDAGFINIPMIVSNDNRCDFKTSIKLKHKKIHMTRANDGWLKGEYSLI